MRKIIINADDFGFSKRYNDGILELIEENIVTSTTVAVERPYACERRLLDYKNISIGIHLEIPENSSEGMIEKQILKFVEFFKKTPSHIDGHNHCHIQGENINAVIKIAKKYDAAVRSVFPEDREKMRKFKIKTPSFLIRWNIYKKDYLEMILKKNNERGITEMLCHPGYYDSNHPTTYDKDRERELLFLKSNSFKRLIKNYSLISYTNL